jgi:MFS family permease
VQPSYVAILRTPHARPLVLASLVGRLSSGTGPLALVLFVQDATGSFAHAGAASAATLLTNGLLAPVRGRLVDRFGQRRCLPPLALAFAAALAGVVVVARPGPAGVAATVALAATAGATVPPLSASMRVLWVSLVGRGPELQTAYALDAVLEEVLYVVGPLLAGALAVAIDPAAGLLAAAGLALVGTIGFVVSPLSWAWSGSQAGPAGWAGSMASRGMRTLALTLAGVGAAVGIWEIGVVAAARREGATPAAAGALLAVWATASAVGGLWYGARTWRGATGKRFLVLLARLALACAPMAAAPSLSALAVVIALVGLTTAPLESAAFVLATELAPLGTLTESATWVTTALNITAAAGIALAGALIDRAGVSSTMVIAWACTAAALLAALAGRASLGAERYRGKHEVRHAAARQTWRARRIL